MNDLVKNSLLSIAGSVIRQDAEGRFCLNDLHKAAGGASKDRPSKWLDAEKTQELIREMNAGKPASEQNQSLRVSKGGDGWQGTFIAKELVYAYAMWISPSFHLKVIRAYDAMATQVTAPIIPKTLPEALRLAAEAIEERDRLALENQAKAEALAIAAPKAEALDLLSAEDGTRTLTQAAKELSLSRTAITTWLHANRWIYRQNGSWLAMQDKINSGHLVYKEAKYTDEDGMERRKPYCHITTKGLTRLAELLRPQGNA